MSQLFACNKVRLNANAHYIALFFFPQGSSSVLVVMVILLNIGVAILFIHFFI